MVLNDNSVPNSKRLVDVFKQIKLADLNELFANNEDKVLDSFMKEVQKGNPKPLIWMPAQLRRHILNTVLTNAKNGILELLVKATREKDFWPFAWVLKELNSGDLNALLMTHDEILEYLVRISKDIYPKLLVSALSKLDPDDLKAVLRTKVDDKPIHEYVKTNRDNIKRGELQEKLTGILQRGRFVD
jgi:hypothetical protein